MAQSGDEAQAQGGSSWIAPRAGRRSVRRRWLDAGRSRGCPRTAAGALPNEFIADGPLAARAGRLPLSSDGASPDEIEAALRLLGSRESGDALEGFRKLMSAEQDPERRRPASPGDGRDIQEFGATPRWRCEHRRRLRPRQLDDAEVDRPTQAAYRGGENWNSMGMRAPPRPPRSPRPPDARADDPEGAGAQVASGTMGRTEDLSHKRRSHRPGLYALRWAGRGTWCADRIASEIASRSLPRHSSRPSNMRSYVGGRANSIGRR